MRYFSRIDYQTGLLVLDMWPWFDKLPKVKPLPGVRKQPGEVECGYYVMRYIKEII
ncbi:hypothetical protein RchiOBHm_Chr4g0411261 [Rosa chinensis]|uniref:Ubiquitin-like protease family profile domain-containing protein n=1 Tax=Rosa chinensis TaxID=74649 RepID=A0A2P6QVJ2_ROSCH|nr:hypothetical protein RchiOBHm_Chr4g0411261 [Rosa chinensis]